MLDLSADFSRFLKANPERLHFSAHSHHFWPNAACVAHAQALDDAIRHVDDKWDVVFGETMPRAARGIAKILSLPDPETIAFAPNTHALILRLLSCFPAGQPLRILTSDGEFHSFARQAARLEEEGLALVTRVPTQPYESFAERYVAAARNGHHLGFVSQVFFDSAATSGDLGTIAAQAGPYLEALVIDGYHGFMALPTDLSAIATKAFYMAGGYKYAMAGENACFLHAPDGFGMRPRDTGWFAAFGALAEKSDQVGYAPKGARFLGATFDPTGLYRMAAVFDWMETRGLTVPAIHDHVVALQDLFLAEVARLGIATLDRGRLLTPVETTRRGHFLTYRLSDARAVFDRLAAAGIMVDTRGDRLRIGFGCYHRDTDIRAGAARIAAALSGESY